MCTSYECLEEGLLAQFQFPDCVHFYPTNLLT